MWSGIKVFICFSCFESVNYFWLSNAVFLSQAMDLYYHNESDPDSYCCPGDNSKSPPNYACCFVFLHFLLFLLLLHCKSSTHPLSVTSPYVTVGSDLSSLSAPFVYFPHQFKFILCRLFLCYSCLWFPINLMAVGAEMIHTHTLTSPHGPLIRPLHRITTSVFKPILLFVVLQKPVKQWLQAENTGLITVCMFLYWLYVWHWVRGQNGFIANTTVL